MMALRASDWAIKGAGGVAAAAEVGAEVFDESVLASYRRTLSEASESGVEAYVTRHMRPYLSAAKQQLAASNVSWTEAALRVRTPGVPSGSCERAEGRDGADPQDHPEALDDQPGSV
jgi:hypothetical protein